MSITVRDITAISMFTGNMATTIIATIIREVSRNIPMVPIIPCTIRIQSIVITIAANRA